MKALLYCAAYRSNFQTPGYGEIPSLTVIEGKTLLEHQVESLQRNGVTHLFVAWPKKAPVPSFLSQKDGVEFLLLDQPLGDAGAIALLGNEQEDLLYVPGDLYFDVDLPSFLAFHQEKEALMTTLVRPEPHPEEKDVLLVKPDGRVTMLLPKETTKARDFEYRNIIPTPLCFLSPDLLSTYDPDDLTPLSFWDDVFAPSLAVEGLFAYRSAEYVEVIGQNKSLDQVKEDVRKGIPARKNRKNPQTAFFLDRDGTLNVFGDYVVEVPMLHLIPGAAEAVRQINEAGYLAILITNQPIVARGEASLSTLHRILAKLEMLLGEQGAYLDGIYYCPHYPLSKPNSVPEYTKECDCRKPRIGMLLHAQKDWNIDFGSSWFIGDTCQDVQTGKNAGTHTVLLLGGDPHPYAKYPDAKPDFVSKDLSEAVKNIPLLS